VSAPRILVVRFAAIGDCVMAAWAATALRRQFPEAFIGWAVQREPVPVLAVPDLVNEVVVFDRRRWKNMSGPAAFREQWAQWMRLRQLNFDVGFDFQGHSKTALALRLSGAKRRISTRATDALARTLNPPAALAGDVTHEVDRAMAAARLISPLETPERPIMPNLDAEVAAFRAEFPGRLITIQTGATESVKRFAPEKWAEVAAGLVAPGTQIVAVGGPGDPEIPHDQVINRVGAYDLRTSMALVAASHLHVAADTGTGHMAAAYGVPVVSVFSKNRPERFRPYTTQGRIIHGGMRADDSDPADVIHAAQELLEETCASSS